MVDSIRCYVMSHNEQRYPESDLYEVIGLNGYKGPRIRKSDLDCSDNISNLNQYFCELTGLYYLWKTIDVDIIGVCHYRRYFNFASVSLNGSPISGWIDIPNCDQVWQVLDLDAQRVGVEKILKEYDVIVPTARYSAIYSGQDYMLAHGEKEWATFLTSLDRFLGETSHSMRLERRNFWCNMFYMRKPLFDEYCEKLFSVIFDVFDKVGPMELIEGARYQPYRYPGYLAERFMAAFINHKKLKYFEADVIVIT